MESVTQEMVVEALRGLGVKPGDWLFVHAAYKSFGAPVEGGPNGLIDALLQAVSPGGTVLAPTHGPAHKEPFHPTHSEMYPGMGAIPHIMAEREDSVRSWHPTHSDVAIGADAEMLLAGHETAGALGPESPLGRLRCDLRGKVLMLGTDFRTLTLVHLAEAEANLPYIGKAWGDHFPPVANIEKDGEVIEIDIEDIPGQSSVFDRVEPVIREAGLIHETKVGDCRMMLVEAGPLVDALVPVLQKDPAFLLGEPEDGAFYGSAHDILRAAGIEDTP